MLSAVDVLNVISDCVDMLKEESRKMVVKLGDEVRGGKRFEQGGH